MRRQSLTDEPAYRKGSSPSLHPRAVRESDAFPCKVTAKTVAQLPVLWQGAHAPVCMSKFAGLVEEQRLFAYGQNDSNMASRVLVPP